MPQLTGRARKPVSGPCTCPHVHGWRRIPAGDCLEHPGGGVRAELVLQAGRDGGWTDWHDITVEPGEDERDALAYLARVRDAYIVSAGVRWRVVRRVTETELVESL